MDRFVWTLINRGQFSDADFEQHDENSGLYLRPDGLPVLFQLAELWWAADRQPFAERDLAARLGVSPRQLNRHLTAFEACGLVKRDDQRADRPVRYDLSGLF